MATGVLVIALGEATKLMPWLTHHDKVYNARIALGVETDTCDAWGVETRRSELSVPLREALRASSDAVPAPLIAAAFDGERARTLQIPPAYSAIHCGGERAYERARRGEAATLTPRAVHVSDLTLLASAEDPPTLTVLIRVSKGYYVRALARDLGASLGTVAHLASLRRTHCGDFSLEGAVQADALSGVLRAATLPLAESAARALPRTHRLTHAEPLRMDGSLGATRCCWSTRRKWTGTSHSRLSHDGGHLTR
jgi:tRNA pseudouridine55 synthase